MFGRHLPQAQVPIGLRHGRVRRALVAEPRQRKLQVFHRFIPAPELDEDLAMRIAEMGLVGKLLRERLP